MVTWQLNFYFRVTLAFLFASPRAGVAAVQNVRAAVSAVAKNVGILGTFHGFVVSARENFYNHLLADEYRPDWVYPTHKRSYVTTGKCLKHRKGAQETLSWVMTSIRTLVTTGTRIEARF